MKKTEKASLLLSLLHILLCLSFQVHVTEARLSHLAIPPSQFLHRPPVPPPMPALPSPPCGSNIGSQTMAQREESCRKIRRPPKTKRRYIQKPPAAIP
uniref:Uncharacterized protein n=1 Tax=Noccaea caerulescens TaxID=107243 RepID=A0A1J3FRG8_NOCCA